MDEKYNEKTIYSADLRAQRDAVHISYRYSCLLLKTASQRLLITIHNEINGACRNRLTSVKISRELGVCFTRENK